MLTYIKTYSLFLLLILTSCLSSKLVSDTGIEEISFGNGGGITGVVKTYVLNADCKLFEKETQLKKVKSKKTLELFNQAKELKNLDYQESGDLYYFIDITTKDQSNRISWAYGSRSVNPDVIKLYNDLVSLTK